MNNLEKITEAVAILKQAEREIKKAREMLPEIVQKARSPNNLNAATLRIQEEILTLGHVMTKIVQAQQN